MKANNLRTSYDAPFSRVSKGYSSDLEERKGEESTKESSSDPFIKLLQMKKTNSDGTSSKNSVNHKLNSHSQQTASPSLKEPKKEENYDAYPTEEKFKATESSRKMPQACSNGESVEAPTFCPTEEQFQDPLKYIEKIRPEAEKFGMARIIPPRSFRVRFSLVVVVSEIALRYTRGRQLCNITLFSFSLTATLMTT